MHLSAEECPHCGVTVADLAVEYAGFSATVARPHDAAGVLRVKERKRVGKWIAQAEKAFPQLYFSVVTVALSNDQDLRSYGYWLMNKGNFREVAETAQKEGCVMIVIDVNRKQVCLLLGYLLDQYMTEEEGFEALASAHPHLLEADYMKAIRKMLKGTRKYVRRLARRAKRLERRRK